MRRIANPWSRTRLAGSTPAPSVRERVLTWIIDRMIDGVIQDNLRRYGYPSGKLNMNPEDLWEIAYLMLCGLFGLKPRAPR